MTLLAPRLFAFEIAFVPRQLVDCRQTCAFIWIGLAEVKDNIIVVTDVHDSGPSPFRAGTHCVRLQHYYDC